MELNKKKLIELIFEKGLGSQIVDDEISQTNSTYRESNKCLFTIKVQPTSESGPERYKNIISLINLAKEYGFAIHPISKGKNLGYGGSEPYKPSVVVDLSAFDKIYNYKNTVGHITVEPGVTQDAISKYLIKKGNLHIHDTTGAPKSASIVGNYLERGFGHTPMAEHAKNILNSEVIIPNGMNETPTIVCSSTDGTIISIENYEVTRTYSIGPDYTGVFIQSNFGVVVNLTIKLLPKPADFVAYFIPFKKTQAKKLIDLCAQLRRQGTIHSGAHIGNDIKTLQLLAAEHPQLISSYEKSELNKVIKSIELDDWTLSGGLYGTSNQIKAHKKDLRASFKQMGLKIIFLGKTRLKVVNKIEVRITKNKESIAKLLSSKNVVIRKLAAKLLLLPGLKALCDVKQGVPTNFFLKTIYWRNLHKLGQPKLDPSAQQVGLIWGAPCAEISGDNFQVLTQLMETTCEKHSLECPISVTLINDRSMECVMSLSYDRNDKEQETRALACYEEMMVGAADMHFVQYRMSTLSNEFLGSEHLSLKTVFLNLKAKLDPCDIISPGKYRLVSENFTTQKGN
ncbi:FAD-binding oxidoreductase [Alteromonas genovensis]|uniref:FAD-binding oxidoreductase n=1 Tax=Alteromonas genovensis TaxID=471225 RepID=UPI002FE0FCC4